VVVQAGNYSYDREKKLQREAHSRRLEQSYKKTAPAAKRERGGRARKLSYNETRELEMIEETILAAEEKVADLEAKLHDPDFFVAHYEEATKLGDALAPARAEVVRLYDRWEELEAIRAAAEPLAADDDG
jgi:ATP-binding cassette subfamily F protein uup